MDLEPPPKRALGSNLTRPLREFLATESSGGIVLLASTIAALLWANLFGGSYDSFWSTRLDIGFIAEDVRHWVNDALMALFFFVVGLEIKRELVSGELKDPRKAMLPAVAAAGGMIGPALIYLAFNAGGAGQGGWGIPMATDIAFAVGVLALFGDRVSSGLKVFLLTLAIADDIGAIVVIAFFYSSSLDLGWLLVAVVWLAGIVVLLRWHVRWIPLYVVMGIAVWFATFESGVHATIAGVALGLLTPARDSGVAERFQHALHPWSSFVVIPIFALANAGLVLTGDAFGNALTSPVALGVAVGLVMGKIVGISLAALAATSLGVARLPEGVSWRHIVGAAAVAGIGFTVSLFIADLAFSDAGLAAEAKIGILAASIVAGVTGALILSTGQRAEGRSS
jgi:NhaA family Na+:H+ antiporter